MFRSYEPDGPELVILPQGRFLMGSPADETLRSDDEGPQHWVEIGYTLAIGKHAVTFDEYDAYARATGRLPPKNAGLGGGRCPAINVRWGDAQAYLAWLNEKVGLTGRLDRYRLPSEAEWEYAARAGTTGPFSFTGPITEQKANYDAHFQYEGSPKGSSRKMLVEVGSLPANPWGLHEVHGNVYQWVEDCWHCDYDGAPTDGSAWVTGCADDRRVVRGGSGFDKPSSLRSASRASCPPDYEVNCFGFRIARTLP